MPRLSLQLYALRELLGEDQLEETFRAVADMGVTDIEAFAPEAFGWLPELLAKYRLTCSSAHAQFLGDRQAASFELCRRLGCRSVFLPHVARETFADAQALDLLAQRLNRAAAAATDWDLTVGYHNHDFEFAHEIAGMTGYDYLVSKLSPQVRLEVDVYWATFAGQDVLALLSRHADRVTHLHLKDGSVRHRAPNVTLGTGQVDLPPILAASQERTWVIEFDDCETPILPAIKASLAYLTAAGR